MVATLRAPSATQQEQRRRDLFRPALAGAVLVGVALRAFAFTGGWLRLPVDFDEGAYSAAGQMLAAGHLPYQDFFFTHPPGIAYLFAVLAPLGPYRALAAARVLAVVMSAGSITLAGIVARRAWGSCAGVAAALAYAVFPEVAWVEHGAFIEPALNLASLAAVACWQQARRSDQPTRLPSWALAAGACAGLAVTFKLWGALLVVAMLAAPPITARVQQLRHAAYGLVGVIVVTWAPMVVLAGGDMWRQVVAFQIGRPGGGVLDRGERLQLLLGSRHVGVALAAALGVVLAVRAGGIARICIVWLALLFALFMAAGTYWDQYNAALGPPAALLVGLAVSWLVACRGVVAGVGLAFVALLGAWQSRVVWRESRTAGGEPAQMVAAIRGHVPAGECVTSYEPGWLLAADRLPVLRFDAVDPYAAQTMRALDELPTRPATADNAFEQRPAPARPEDEWGPCRYVAVGARGWAQMSPARETLFRSAYRPVDDVGGVWVRATRR